VRLKERFTIARRRTKCEECETHQVNVPYLSGWKGPCTDVEALSHLNNSALFCTISPGGSDVDVGTGVGACEDGICVRAIVDGVDVGDFEVGGAAVVETHVSRLLHLSAVRRNLVQQSVKVGKM
jgi:hypothetical protein